MGFLAPQSVQVWQCCALNDTTYLQSWSDVVLKQKLLTILHFISRWVVVIVVVVVVCFTIPSLNSGGWWCKKLPRCTTVYSTVYRLQQNMCNVQWLLMLMHGQEEAGDMVDTASSWQPTSASSSSLLPSAFELSSTSLNCHQWRLSSSLLAPKELYTWYCSMTINPLFEHTPVLNNNFEYWCRDDFGDCDYYDD